MHLSYDPSDYISGLFHMS